MRGVLVTGLGAVSPFGAGTKAYWAGLAAGACAIRPLTVVDPAGFRCRIAAEVPEIAGGSARRSRADRLALGAAVEALDDAGLGADERAGAALVVGAVGGGMLEAESWYWARSRGEHAPGWAASLRSMLPAAHAETLAHRLALGGPRHTVVTACSSGAVALAEAAELIADGVVDCAVAGGVDAVTRLCFMGFNALKLLDPEPCRPFDRDRRGMSIGEGAAFVVLEAADHARARGARVRALVVGHGTATDAHHVTAPHPEGAGARRALEAALDGAGLPAQAVGYVNAHGSGTHHNDEVEIAVLRAVFGERLPHVPVSSTKSQVGHCLAAAGAIEAVATVVALERGLLPPTVNLRALDPAWADLDLVPRAGRRASLGIAVTSSSGFGGHNVTLVLARPGAL